MHKNSISKDTPHIFPHPHAHTPAQNTAHPSHPHTPHTHPNKQLPIQYPYTVQWFTRLQRMCGWVFFLLTFVYFFIGHDLFTNALKFTNVYIFKKEILRKYNTILIFLPKTHYFLRISWKHLLGQFYFETGYKNIMDS